MLPAVFQQDYPKLSQSFYSLLEVLTQDHMNFFASLEPHVAVYILSSISEGLTALGNPRRPSDPPVDPVHARADACEHAQSSV